MSLFEAVALLLSVLGIYVLIRRPGGNRFIVAGTLRMPVNAALGGALSAAGLLFLIMIGVWPADWWSGAGSVLAARSSSTQTAGPLDLLIQSPGFWGAAAVAVTSAVLVVAGSARVFPISLIVFSLAVAILLGIASDIPGASALAATAAYIACLVKRSRNDESDTEPGGHGADAFPETFLATVTCVLLAWGLIRAVHIAATFEAGPDLAGKGTVPALPRAARDEATGITHQGTDSEPTENTEAWLLALSASVILIAGAVGTVSHQATPSDGDQASGPREAAPETG